jgi:pyruvate/2-oxoglutarate dehydrogenase complex dihydrolipoamide dehydrogenase (E3) component
MLARLPGDEFALLVRRVPSISEVDELVQRVMLALQRPFQVADTECFVSVSVGIALYPRDGDAAGILKLLFHRETRGLLGVHILGTSATELVHIGQAVIGLGGTLDYFVETVFNYPTFAECYKVAALDAFNKLGPKPA